MLWHMDDTEKVRAGAQAGEKYIVRFPDGMRERIADAAKVANRSMNAEIVDRLQKSLDAPFTPDEVKVMARAIERQHDVIKMLGFAMKAIAEAPVQGRTPYGEQLAAMFASAGKLFGEGDMREAGKVMDEIFKSTGAWAKTPEGLAATERDRKLFGNRPLPPGPETQE